MIHTQRFLPGCQSALVQRFGFRVFPLVLVNERHIIERLCESVIVGPQNPLANGHHSKVELKCLLVRSRVVVEQREVVQCGRDLGIIGAKDSLLDSQCASVKSFSRCVLGLAGGIPRRFLSGLAASGWSGPSALSRIARARMLSGSAFA